MPAVFADTWYWVALVDRDDDGHNEAKQIAQQLTKDRVRIYTSEMVLSEFLNQFCKHNAHKRKLATDLVYTVRADRHVTIFAQDATLFELGFQLYESRPDKSYSHTDCASMSLMTIHEIKEAVTHDHHFVQENYVLYAP